MPVTKAITNVLTREASISLRSSRVFFLASQAWEVGEAFTQLSSLIPVGMKGPEVIEAKWQRQLRKNLKNTTVIISWARWEEKPERLVLQSYTGG